MCGIVGFVCQPGAMQLRANLLREATKLIHHRGPDAWAMAGCIDNGPVRLLESASTDPLHVGLGHTRLSIIDLSEGGSQPMRDPEGAWIVFNGEIYNYLELRTELRELGCTFHTDSDTEVVLAAYRQWGPSCVNRFNGMWSLALLEGSGRRMFCSRDRLGKKPFYYQKDARGFFFASEVHALFALRGERPQPLAGELADYLLNHISDHQAQTLYSGVFELRGGHSLLLDLETGGVQVECYWTLPEEADLELNDAAALERFSELLEDSVRLRLRADVPVAITLSGGVDSSAITLAATRTGRDDIRTFTSSFRDQPEIDETEWALKLARSCGAVASLVEPRLGLVIEEERLLTWHQALPIMTLSPYVNWSILKEIRAQGIPVVLTGQGGDELFAGYERYYAQYILSYRPDIARMWRETRLAGANSRLGLRNALSYLAYFTLPQLRNLQRWRRVRGVFHPNIEARMPRSTRGIPTDRRGLQQEELLGAQLGHLLRWDDRTAGALSMEARVPFLDYRLVEFAYRLPWHHKVRDGWTKFLIRRYIDRHAPNTVAWRRVKAGFPAPQATWTRALYKERGAALLSSDFAKHLLAPGTNPLDRSVSLSWDVYNILHLAAQMNWTAPV
jgi:asparagine synthase (glutamine-hydrolysing)